MKTLNLTSLFVLVLVAVIGISTASAKTPEQKKDVRQILKEAVYYPEFALQEGNQGKVDVAFKVADNGKLDIRKVESVDPKLSKFVKEQLSKIDLKDTQVDKFKTYKVSISFELQ
ncbi:MAG: hypothetical protein ACM3N9_00970 [Syntrophothermus sp.]